MKLCAYDNDSQIGSQGYSYTPHFGHLTELERWKILISHKSFFTGNERQFDVLKRILKRYTPQQRWVKRANGMHSYAESYIEMNSGIIVALTPSNTTNEAAIHKGKMLAMIPGGFLETLTNKEVLKLLDEIDNSCFRFTSGDIKACDTFNIIRPEQLHVLTFNPDKRLPKGVPNLLPCVKGWKHGKYFKDKDNCQTVQFEKKEATLKFYDAFNKHNVDETHLEYSLEADRYREFISQLLSIFRSNKSEIAINKCLEFVLGTILGSIDFRVRENERWDRCPEEKWWTIFKNESRTFKIVVPKKKENPITKKWNWVKKTVERNLKALIANKAGIPLKQLNDSSNHRIWKQWWNEFGDEVFDRECSPQHEALAEYGLASA